MNKDERQEISFQKWKDNSHNGIIVGGTGYGKTHLAINKIITYCQLKLNFKTILVIVPRIVLKEDWEKRLIKANVSNIEVVVINTAITKEYDIDLIILDEIHNFAATTFSNIFKVCKYKAFLGLTPELERTDEKHTIILQYSKIVDVIPLKECIINGWTSNLVIKKIPVNLNSAEQKQLEDLNNKYEQYSKELGGNPFKSANYYLRYLNINLWFKGKSGKLYTRKSLISSYKAKHSVILSDIQLDLIIAKDFIQLTKEEKERLQKLALIAKKWYQTVNKRKSLLYNIESKKNITLELLKEDKKTIVFAQEIQFLEALYEKMSNVSIYHSNMSKKDKMQNLEDFKNNKTKIMISALALIEGLDIPDLERAIIASYTSSKIKAIQSQGRIIRKYKDKIAEIIYLYVPKSQEEKWLNNLDVK